MAKCPCKGEGCTRRTNIPPNREATATGYCRQCYLGNVRRHG